tara:strand:+ start:3214 stop:3651 length:438 start_codon:yes stop_codon:yes gene_type:complete
MKYVEVKGGQKHQREMIQKLAEWTLQELLPRHRKVEVTIRLKDLTKEGVEGWCMEEDDRYFLVDVEKKQTLRDIVTTVVHELIHVKQYVKREMVDFYDVKTQSRKIRWKTSVYGYGTAYARQPWEKEAFKLQEVYADRAWNEGVL